MDDHFSFEGPAVDQLQILLAPSLKLKQNAKSQWTAKWLCMLDR